MTIISNIASGKALMYVLAQDCLVSTLQPLPVVIFLNLSPWNMKDYVVWTNPVECLCGNSCFVRFWGLLSLFVIFLLLSDSSKKFEYNSLDRKSYRKIGSRKNNKNPPSLIVVDTDETHHNTSIFKRDKHKKRQVIHTNYLDWSSESCFFSSFSILLKTKTSHTNSLTRIISIKKKTILHLR